jgi:hypothetical protein
MKRYVKRGHVIKADAINRAVNTAIDQVVSLNPGVSRVGDNVLYRVSRGAGGGGGGGGSGGVDLTTGTFKIEEVNTLPPIPTKGWKRVYWRTPEQGGTGDGQMWEAYAGYTRWAPCNFLTDKQGIPGE